MKAAKSQFNTKISNTLWRFIVQTVVNLVYLHPLDSVAVLWHLESIVWERIASTVRVAFFVERSAPIPLACMLYPVGIVGHKVTRDAVPIVCDMKKHSDGMLDG
jgi:hypothetical protein